tara:strand:+ start:346 stop:519 length:174 start_codon:yes stop_codon:yes gene_type:complete
MKRMDEREWKERAESAELRLKRVLNRAAWHRKYLVSVNDYEKACICSDIIYSQEDED